MVTQQQLEAVFQGLVSSSGSTKANEQALVKMLEAVVDAMPDYLAAAAAKKAHPAPVEKKA